MSKMLSFRADEEIHNLLAQLMSELRQTKTQVVEDAIRAYAERILPKDGEEPYVAGYTRYRPKRDTVCWLTGEPIPAGTLAWKEDWSDGREGHVVLHDE